VDEFIVQLYNFLKLYSDISVEYDNKQYLNYNKRNYFLQKAYSKFDLNIYLLFFKLHNISCVNRPKSIILFHSLDFDSIYSLNILRSIIDKIFGVFMNSYSLEYIKFSLDILKEKFFFLYLIYRFFDFLKENNKNYEYVIKTDKETIICEFLNIYDIYPEYGEVIFFINILLENLKQNEELYNNCFLLYNKSGKKMWENLDENSDLKMEILSLFIIDDE
jgi:hypothetical protein